MSARIKTIKKGVIDPVSFSVRRRIEIDKKDLDEWKKNIFSVSNPTAAPVLLRNSDGKLQNNSVLPKIIGGRIEFPINYNYPQFILNAVTSLRMLYNLKSEAQAFRVILYPPCKTENENKLTVYEIPKTDISIVSRIIIVSGHRECFRLHASAAGQSGEGKIICNSGDSFSIPMAICAGLDIDFDNSMEVTLADKKGFRSGVRKEKKSDLRYICIIDFDANVEVVSKYVINKAKDLAGDNKELFDKITKPFLPGEKIEEDVEDFIKVLEQK